MQYKKNNCRLCQAKKLSFWYYPNSTEEDKDIFWCAVCTTCREPMVVYKWHNEPSDKEVKYLIDWAKEWFPLRIPDFQRRTIPDHFHFHLRRAKGKIDIHERKTYIRCPECTDFYESKLMRICSSCHTIQCKSCFIKIGCLGCKVENREELDLEEQLEETQFDDQDAEVLGYA